MKLAIFVLITVATTAGALAMPSNAWPVPPDARPEALIMGSGLLVLAALLRHRSPNHHIK